MNTTTDRIGLGIVLVITSTALVALQESTIKELSASTSLWQIYVTRSAILVPAFLALGVFQGLGTQTLRQAVQKWPLIRSLCFMGVFSATYVAIQSVPLATIAAGLYTAPLFVAAITSIWGLEPPNWRRWFAILMGFVGVLLILKPATSSFDWLTTIPVIGGLCYALVGIVTRTRCRSIPPTSIAMSLTLTLLAFGLFGTLFVQVTNQADNANAFLLGPWQSLGGREWLFLAALSVLMFGNGLVLPAAYQLAPTTIVATFDYSFLLFSAFLGFLFFGEVPDVVSVIGMAMIVGAGLIVARSA